jgi:hypothetical protein
MRELIVYAHYEPRSFRSALFRQATNLWWGTVDEAGSGLVPDYFAIGEKSGWSFLPPDSR